MERAYLNNVISLVKGREHIEWLYLVPGVGQSRCREIFNAGMLIAYATLPQRCVYIYIFLYIYAPQTCSDARVPAEDEDGS